ncbi:TPA: extracellular electron transfer flavoprotein PplA, partial [Enterococcus faecium]
TESKYDNVNENGESKTKDAEYNKNMEAKSGTNPEKYIPELNDQFLKAQSASGVEVVTGATHSSESFQNYAQQLIQAAQAGNTDTIEIDNGADLKDGTYKLEEKNYSNGYRVQFEMTVAGGKVTESNFDYIDKDGKSKQDDTEYNENMKAKSGTEPKTYIPTLNDEFVKAMGEEDGSPANVEVVTGATHSSHSFIMYAQQLVNAAEKGDTQTIEVDNIVTEK